MNYFSRQMSIYNQSYCIVLVYIIILKLAHLSINFLAHSLSTSGMCAIKIRYQCTVFFQICEIGIILNGYEHACV